MAVTVFQGTGMSLCSPQAPSNARFWGASPSTRAFLVLAFGPLWGPVNPVRKKTALARYPLSDLGFEGKPGHTGRALRAFLSALGAALMASATSWPEHCTHSGSLGGWASGLDSELCVSMAIGKALPSDV